MFYFLSSPWLCWMCDVVTPCYALFCFSQWSFYVQLTVLKISFLPWYFYCEWVLCCTVKMTFTVTEIFTVNHPKNQTPAERNWIKLKCYEWKWMNSNWSMRRLTFYGLDILQFVAVLGRWYLTLAAPHSTLDLCWASFNTWRWLHLIKYLTLAAPHSTLNSTLDVGCTSFNTWFNTWRWLHLIQHLTLAAPHSTLDVGCTSFNTWCCLHIIQLLMFSAGYFCNSSTLDISCWPCATSWTQRPSFGIELHSRQQLHISNDPREHRCSLALPEVWLDSRVLWTPLAAASVHSLYAHLLDIQMVYDAQRGSSVVIWLQWVWGFKYLVWEPVFAMGVGYHFFSVSLLMWDIMFRFTVGVSFYLFSWP